MKDKKKRGVKGGDKVTSKRRAGGKKNLKLLSQTEFESIARVNEANSNLHISESDRESWRLVFFPPNETSVEDADRLTFNVGPYRDAELKFHPIHPLVMDCKYELTVRELDSEGSEKTNTADSRVSLKPEKHGVWPPPSTGALGYFTKLRTSYNGNFTNDTEVLHSANLDELNTMASMDLFFTSDEDLLSTFQSYGLVPIRNNEGKTVSYLKKALGSVPRQNYPDTTASSKQNDGEGFYKVYGHIATPPFRKFSPQMWTKMKLNSGGDARIGDNTITFPPTSSFRFEFMKTPKENYLHEFYFPTYTDVLASTQVADAGVFRTFSHGGATFLIKEIHWVVDNVQLCGYLRPHAEIPKIRFPLFNTYVTCRRVQETLLGPDRFPIISYFVDQKMLGLNLILCFRRGIELDRNPTTTTHSFSAQTCYRPSTLDKIEVLEGGDSGGDFLIFNQNSLKNLSYEKLDPSMMAYVEKLAQEGWISKKQIRQFFEMPSTQKSSRGTPSQGNVGVQNFFPISLGDPKARKKFNFYTANGLRGENLFVRLEFTQPLDKRWYLVIISEYLVHLTFDSVTGAPAFEVCS